jgi:hypothetical protein
MPERYDFPKKGAPDVAIKFETRIDSRTTGEMAWNLVNAWPLLLAVCAWMIFASGLCAWLPREVAPNFCINGATAAPLGDIGRALYYNASMLTSVGAPDITPASEGARAISLIDSVLGVVLLGLIIGMVSTAFEATKDDGKVKTFLKSTWFAAKKPFRRLFGSGMSAQVAETSSENGQATESANESKQSPQGDIDHDSKELGAIDGNVTDPRPPNFRAQIYQSMLECLDRRWVANSVEKDGKTNIDVESRLRELEIRLASILNIVNSRRGNISITNYDADKQDEENKLAYAVLPSSILIEASIVLAEAAVSIGGKEGESLAKAVQEIWRSSVVVGLSIPLSAVMFDTFTDCLGTAGRAVQKLFLEFDLRNGSPRKPAPRL